MKNKNYIFIVIVFIAGTLPLNLLGQCSDDNTSFLSWNLTTAGQSVSTTCIYGGEYNSLNVVTGYNYTFSTCGDTDFDTQMTLYNASTGTSVGYNDDYCGLQSEITWTATFSGTLRILIDKYYCSGQSTCMTLTATLNSLSTSINPCNSISNISCGAVSNFTLVSGSGAWSNGPYGTPGTEQIFSFIPVQSGIHSISITNNEYYIDLFYKTGSCSSSGWTYVDDIYTTANHDITMTAGVTYYFMLDDENTSASSGTLNISCPVACPGIINAPYTENFDGITTPVCWSKSGTGSGWEFPGTPGWDAATATDHSSNGGNFACIDYSGSDAATILQLGDIDISTLAEPYLEFYFFSVNNNSGTLNYLYTEAWNGSSWIIISTLQENNGGWTIYRYPLSSYTYNSNLVRLRFRGESSGLSDDYLNDLLIDDVSVLEDPCSTIRNEYPEADDSHICEGESSTITAELIDGGTLNWYDAATGGSIVQTGSNYTESPSTSVSYWVEESDANSCVSLRKEVTIHVSNYPSNPVTTDVVACSGSISTLSAAGTTGSSLLNWYTSASGGSPVNTGNNYNCTVNTNQTYWVEEFGGQQVGIASHNSTYSNATRGYWFTAPCDFNISGVRVPTDASTGNQSVEIVKLNSPPPSNSPSIPATALTSLFRSVNIPGNNIVTCNLSISKGDIIGVLGVRSTNAVNSYGANNYVTNIYGKPVTLKSLGMQFNLQNTAAQYLFTENSSPNGRVELFYGNCGSNRTAVTATVSEPYYTPYGTNISSDANCVVNEGGTEWTYYYNNAAPENILFAIAHDPDNLGNNSFNATVNITVNIDPANPSNFSTGIFKAEDISNQEACFALGRYWNVSTTGSITDPVKIRFYFHPSELTAINTAANNWMANHNNAPYGIAVDAVEWFKTNNTVYNPATAITPGGLNGTIDLTEDAIEGLSTNSGINYVQINDINGFSGGSVAVRVSRNSSLDVSLTSFTVKKQEKRQSLLQWTTEREENMNHFDIERSNDGIIFEKIGRVYPEGGLNKTVEYQFTDKQPFAGLNYYRLSMEEISGHIDYSETKVLEFQGIYNVLNVQPNPFESEIIVLTDSRINEIVTIDIYNTLGQPIYNNSFALKKGSNKLLLNLDRIMIPGSYWMHYNNGNNTMIKKIIKK